MSVSKKRKASKKSRTARQSKSKCLSDNVRDAMEKYFKDLDGHEPNNLHELVMSQVEKPLIESVIDNARGNISRAAQLLGLNRGTLRNRMQKYGLDK
jgi:Fis family transcriptional regulator